MNGDPYEDADGRDDSAKLVTPDPAKKNRKVVVGGFVLVGAILGIVILANIAGLVTGQTSSAAMKPKPVTMTREQSLSFGDQQSGQAAFLKGMDRDKQLHASDDAIMGYGKGLASAGFAEADGVPARTKAQDAVLSGQPSGGAQSGGVSAAEQAREHAQAEAAHRRQNDLDSSPMALDFSDYFAKEKQPAEPVLLAQNAPGALVSTLAGGSIPAADPPDAPAATMMKVARRRSPIAEALAEGIEPVEQIGAAKKKQPHDPDQDFVFDSSFGKLYRLMEDTIVETVLVNRLAGAASGPVITMVSSDIYSASGAHLLIPKGTRLLGSVTAVGSTNQERLFIAFHRMIMPDGYSVSLDKFKGLDVVGQTGLRDLVNHHYVQIFGASLALAAVAATAQIGNSSGIGTYDWGTQMRNGMSEGLGQSAQRVMERFMNILPTFTVRERARVKIMLAGDILLPDTKNHTMDPDL